MSSPELHLYAAVITAAIKDLREQYEALVRRRDVVEKILAGQSVHVSTARTVWLLLKKWREARDFFLRDRLSSTLPELCHALGRDPESVRFEVSAWMSLPWNGVRLQGALDTILRGTRSLERMLCENES